jgi:PAS domain S-box-containing protein
MSAARLFGPANGGSSRNIWGFMLSFLELEHLRVACVTRSQQALMQKTSIGDLSAGTRDEFPVVTTTMPANAGHYKIVSGGFIILVALIAIAMPFANVPLRRVDAFTPVTQTVICIADLLTATFLFAHYWLQPQRALLALASGFVSGGLFAFLQSLAFPDAYGPGVLLGDQLNSAGWLFLFWHTVFPLAVIVYTLSKDAGDADQRTSRSTGATIGITIACVVVATAGLSWVATAGAKYLPNLYETATEQAPFARVVAIYLALLTTIALALLFVRRRTILDQWLILTLLGWLPTFLVAATVTVMRFSLGWYMVRIYALLAGSSLLFVLLAETLFLYARLANTVVLLRRERADRLAIFNTVVDGVITIDLSGTIKNLNPAAANLFGYSPEEVIGSSVKMLMPELTCPEHDGDRVNQLETGQVKMSGPCGGELMGRRKDGSAVPIELAIGEVDVAGRKIYTGIVRDITERKRTEEHQALLVAELDHRVKNILAQVAVVASSARQSSRSIDEFLQSLDGRIQSMAAAHSLLSRNGWQSVGLDALVRNELAPYTVGANATISGTDVALPSVKIQALARVLHELATNAAKYGALSVPSGQVSVSWDRKRDADGANLILVWQEHGGPPVKSAVRSSYGTNLIRNLIPHELGGKVELMFASQGVSCRIEIPTGRT